MNERGVAKTQDEDAKKRATERREQYSGIESRFKNNNETVREKPCILYREMGRYPPPNFRLKRNEVAWGNGLGDPKLP
jgi:hypothetical protein